MRRLNTIHFLFVIFLLSMPLLWISCGDDEEPKRTENTDESDNQETTEKTVTPTGTIIFSLGDTNTASADNPAVVTADEPLALRLTQQSTYTDSKGQAHSCEPKASASVKVESSEVHADDLKALLTVTEKTETDNSGSDSFIRSTHQIFTIGKQVITFDLSYEFYTCSDPDGHTAVMPYVLLNPARHGTPTATETTRTSSHNAAVHLSGIRLTPISAKSQTRGSYNQEQHYDVVTGFTIKAETMGDAVKNEQQTLYVEVRYEAVITTQHEYPDPELTFGYQLKALSGTTDNHSPFAMTGQQMELEWQQTADYTWFNLEQLQTEKMRIEPKANMSLTASKDTVWVEDANELEQIVPGNAQTSVTDADGAKLHNGKKSFTVGGGQVIDFNWNYTAYNETEVEGYKVSWPYLTLSEPQLLAVQKAELPNVKIPGKRAKVYQITLRFKQSVSGVHTPEAVSEANEYVVKYIGVQLLPEVKLLEVKYRKDFVWYEPQYNLPLRNQYILYRDSIFSDGTTKTMETFTTPYAKEGGVFALPALCDPNVDTLWTRSDGNTFFSHAQRVEHDEAYRTPFIVYTKTGVPDLSKVSVTEPYEKSYYGDAGDWETYSDFSFVPFNSQNPQKGWYTKQLSYNRYVRLVYESPDLAEIRKYDLTMGWYDHFCYQDGQLFDYLDYKASLDWDFRREDITMKDGSPAIVFTHECTLHWMGKDFYQATVDTVYQRK